MPKGVKGFLRLRVGAKAGMSTVGVVCLLGCAPDQAEVSQSDLGLRLRSQQGNQGNGAGLPLTAAELTTSAPAAAAPDVDVSTLSWENVVLAAQAGYYAKAAPGQDGALRGADLGWTFKHHDKLWIMYGDSYWIDPYNIKGRPDDALGQISLLDFPDADSVEAFVSSRPAAQGQPAWRAAAPTMEVAVQQSGGYEPIITEREGRELYSGIGAVAVAAFSNGRSGAAEGVFGVFFNYELIPCDSGQCSDGYVCDAGLGVSKSGAMDVGCVIGSSASCRDVQGLCQDRDTNRYDPSTDYGRITSLPLRHALGVTTSANPTHFTTQAWPTLRFFNSTGRTVTDFDASRPAGAGNDYTPAEGDGLSRSGVFLWGRTHFGGIGKQGRDLRLYLLWAPMPVPDSDMQFEWKPRYFTGLDSEQRPQFSEIEQAAKPLDLDAETAGDQPEEVHDVVGQMNITWVPSLQHFVMFYGGGSSGFAEGVVISDDPAQIQQDPQGSLWLRFAKHPWGPWTTPQQLMAAGDHASDAMPTGQYAEGGILAHNNCRTDKCARSDPAYILDFGKNNNGVLYAPSFIDAWTTAKADETSLYWLLSTWNPYQTVLMRTTLRPQ